MAKKRASKRGRGRTAKLDDPRNRAKLLKTIVETGLLKHSCRAIGLTYQAFQNYRNTHREFADLVEEAEEQSVDDLEVEAHKRARNGSDTLIKFLLACKRPEKYSQRQQVSHSGSVGHDIRIVEDMNWYGNAANNLPSNAASSSDGGAIEPGPVQGSGLRPAVGEDSNGTSGSGEGTRAEEGDV